MVVQDSFTVSTAHNGFGAALVIHRWPTFLWTLGYLLWDSSFPYLVRLLDASFTGKYIPLALRTRAIQVTRLK